MPYYNFDNDFTVSLEYFDSRFSSIVKDLKMEFSFNQAIINMYGGMKVKSEFWCMKDNFIYFDGCTFRCANGEKYTLESLANANINGKWSEYKPKPVVSLGDLQAGQEFNFVDVPQLLHVKVACNCGNGYYSLKFNPYQVFSLSPNTRVYVKT